MSVSAVTGAAASVAEPFIVMPLFRVPVTADSKVEPPFNVIDAVPNKSITPAVTDAALSVVPADAVVLPEKVFPSNVVVAPDVVVKATTPPIPLIVPPDEVMVPFSVPFWTVPLAKLTRIDRIREPAQVQCAARIDSRRAESAERVGRASK